MSSSKLPYVFLLDWDGTIAGRVDFQVQQFLLHNTLRKHGYKPVRQNPIPAAFYPNAKLIRPGFASFVKSMQKLARSRGTEAYFFVYTASERVWAHQEVAWVEKTHNIRFMRPVFTRDDCVVDEMGNVRKAVSKVFPRIMRNISKATGVAFGPRDRVDILENRLIIIDNNAVYTDRPDKLLLCPDYNYAVFENLLHGVPQEARAHPVIQQFIFGLVNNGYLCPLPSMNDDGMRSLARQYEWLALKCSSLIKINTVYESDDFWKYLRKLIHGNELKTFSVSVIRQLQEAVWKHAKRSGSASGNTSNKGL